MRRHGNLIAWGGGGGLFVRVDRATPWGNPFVLSRDGDREAVIARFRDHHHRSSPAWSDDSASCRAWGSGGGARPASNWNGRTAHDGLHLHDR
jgi:hypothetical protein